MSQGVSFREPKTTQQASLDKAGELLDLVVAGVEPSYDAVRDRLAVAYRAGGLSDMANFIEASN